jgi:hypothetical protein
VKPNLYRGEPDKIRAWELGEEDVARILREAEVWNPPAEAHPFAARWPMMMPTEAMLESGRVMQMHGDDVDPNGMRNIASAADRADGHVGEDVMDQWLTWLGVPHVWNGGPNALPDFVIRNTPVAFRACATRTTLTEENYVYIFDRHAHSGPQQRFFGYVNRSTGLHSLVGGTTLDEFMSQARVVEEGEQLQHGFVARHRIHVRTIRCLTDPLDWLAPLD